ncbi:hypothetical protein [Thermococcus sp.]|uniref:hypothetical protein n=1 Tax=Thermococcus sp. TaxID=35749 RepID=UPI00260128E4|nr:hypothetical protein [Thermococcus sp.]
MIFNWGYHFTKHEGPRFKVAEYLKVITAVLLIFWLFKEPLKLETYNDWIAYAIIALIFAFELLSVGRWFGVTVSGLVFALAKGAFWTSVFLFFGKWLGMSGRLHSYDGTVFAYAVILTIAGLLLAKFDERRLDLKVEKKAYEFSGIEFSDVRLSGSGKAYPVRFGRKRVGWVLDGEFVVKVETPLGKVNKKLIPPVIVWTEENLGEKKISPDPAFVARVNELVNPERLYRKDRDSVVDLGFIKVYEGEGFEYVKLPFIEVIDTPTGEEVRIGPMRIRDGNPEMPPGDMLTIRELSNGFQLTKTGSRLKIQTEEYSIETADGERVIYKSGDESLSLGEAVSLRSRDVSVTVGRGRARVKIEDVVISARDGIVRIRAGGKTHTIESSEAYKLVVRKAKEIVEEQSAELIEGLGIDRTLLNKRVKELLDELMEYVR